MLRGARPGLSLTTANSAEIITQDRYLPVLNLSVSEVWP